MQGASPILLYIPLRKGMKGAPSSPFIEGSDSLSILILLQLLNALLVVQDLLVVGYRLVHLFVSFWLIENKQTKDKNNGRLGRDQTIHVSLELLINVRNMHF